MMRGNHEKKENGRHIISCALLAAACLAMALILASCGKEEISLSIKDGKAETTITAYTRDTVQSVLDEAEISVGENDVVTPELSYRLTAEDTQILIERYAAVTVVDGEDSHPLELTGKTVQDAMDAAGITLGENDSMDQEPDTYLTDGMVITVTRAYSVTLVLDGETSELISTADTVDALIEEQEIDLGDECDISPAQDTALEDGMEIVIKRTITEEVVEEEEVEYETTYENSSSMYSGETSVKQEGVNGTKEVTYEVTYVNGEEVSREAVSEEVTVEPVNEIILQGTKKKSSGKTVVKKTPVYDCDGSGHGYYIIEYADGSTKYQDF